MAKFIDSPPLLSEWEPLDAATVPLDLSNPEPSEVAAAYGLTDTELDAVLDNAIAVIAAGAPGRAR